MRPRSWFLIAALSLAITLVLGWKGGGIGSSPAAADSVPGANRAPGASSSARPAPPRSGISPDDQALRDMEASFARAVAVKDPKAFTSFWSEDAAIFPPGEGLVTGRDKILESWSSLLNNPEASLTWKPQRVEVSSSGDLGYTYGPYESRHKRVDGQVVVRTGHYVTIWRKESDGRWRAVLDIGSPDPAPVAKPAEKPAEPAGDKKDP